MIMKKFTGMILRWLASTKILSSPRKIFVKAVTYAFLSRGILVTHYYMRDKTKILDLIRRTRDEVDILLTDTDAYQIFITVKATEKIEGDVAEVGVGSGGSAKIISEAKGDRHLHLFDTFEGLPEPEGIDAPFYKGQYCYSFKGVKEYLQKYKNLHFYVGLFPLSAEPIRNKKFSFVHLDADLYKTTLDALEFFYPRMNPGGVIMSHDYIRCGVKKAFDEFFKDKPEPIIQLIDSQSLIVKI